MRKILLTLLFLVPFLAHAFDVEIGDIYYKLDKTAKTAEVTNQTGNWGAQSYSGDVVIPSAIISDGVNYSVTSIGISAFEDCSSLTSVTIPSSVTSIGISAFQYCSGLTSVVIPSSVTSIEISAFFGCSGLTSITIPNSVTSIGNGAFLECSGLTSINVESSNPFYSSVEGVLFNKTKTELIQCPGGKVGSYSIPASVTSIGISAFADCSGLTSVTIGNSVTSIRERAFQYCSGLTSVTIGNSVTSIGTEAFENCQNLAEVYCYAVSVPETGSDVFTDCNINRATLYVPSAALSQYSQTSPWSEFREILPIENAGNPPLDPEAAKFDHNGDGKVTISDVNILLDYLLKH